jgi:hypothetical protein
VSGSFSIGRKAGPVRRTSTKKRTSKKATPKKADSERRSWLASRLTSTKRKKTSKPKRPTSRR